MEPLISNRHKLALTAITVFSYFSYGLSYNILGQTQKTLQQDAGTNAGTFSYVFTCRAILYCFGNIFFVWLFKHVNRQLIYAFNLLLMGVAVSLTALFPHLVNFLVNQAVYGFAAGGFDVASNVLILEMWTDRSQPFIQAVHLFFGVGATVAPLISTPFTLPDNNSTKHHNMIFTTESPPNRSQIYIPYAITGTVAVTAAFIVAVYELFFPYKAPVRAIRRKNERLLDQTDSESIDDNSKIETRRLPSAYYYTLIALSTLVLTFYLTIEANILTYITTFVKSLNLGISDTTALRIAATFGTVFSVCRLVAIFLSFKVKPAIMLYISLTVLFVSNLIMLVSGWTSVQLVWVTTGFLGAGCSWIYGAMYTFVEERIDVTNVIGGMFMCTTSLATAVNPIIMGHFIEANPLVFAYANFADVVILIILFVALRSTDFWKKSLLRTNTPQLNSTT